MPSNILRRGEIMEFCLRVHLESDIIIGTGYMSLSLSEKGTGGWCGSINVKINA